MTFRTKVEYGTGSENWPFAFIQKPKAFGAIYQFGAVSDYWPFFYSVSFSRAARTLQTNNFP